MGEEGVRAWYLKASMFIWTLSYQFQIDTAGAVLLEEEFYVATAEL
jgi:hypothetical protein